MPTFEDVNSIIDAMKSRIETNITSLGGTAGTTVIEGDEQPAGVRVFPSFYITPLLEGGDKITTHMSNTPQKHEFSVIVSGVYKGANVSSLLRTTRNYGYAAVDLFSVSNQAVSGIYYDEEGKVDTTRAIKAYCVNPVLEVGYHQVRDYILHVWSVRFQVTMHTM